MSDSIGDPRRSDNDLQYGCEVIGVGMADGFSTMGVVRLGLRCAGCPQYHPETCCRSSFRPGDPQWTEVTIDGR
jgi:hypothetical protein